MLLGTTLLLGFLGGQARGQGSWQKYYANPVIPGFPGADYAFSPSVVFDQDAGFYRMWFTARPYGGAWSIYSAISPDGMTWYSLVTNPILEGGGEYFDSDGVEYCSVLHDEGVYRMYYTGVHGCCGTAIGLATSPDGTHWTKFAGNPVLVPSINGWDSQYVAFPQVYFDGAVYCLYYEGSDGATAQTGLATSTDGLSWTKSPTNPVLSPGGPGSWDEGFASPGGVFSLGGTRFMLYTSRSASGPQTIGLAQSLDGISWSKFPGNPVLTGGGVANWDWTIRAGSVVVRENTLQLWYSGDPVTDGGWATGYATSSFDPTAVAMEVPAAMTLHESFPNPFHRETAILFELPGRAFVSARLYDLQGHAVATLAGEEMGAGRHSLRLDAASWHLANGVYFLRLTAGAAARSQKIILIR
jgi:predicted GH43/DUF377 family glycosyl hydrolase